MGTPDWKLERMAVGEIPVDPREGPGVEALRRENEEILAAHPPGAVVAEVERRARREIRKPARRVALVFAPALAAAVAIVSMLPWPVETERIKGAEPYLVIHRRAGDRAERLEPGAEVRAGDVLQVSYVSLGRPYGVIFSIDGRGAVTLHHPASSEADASLIDLDRAVPLANAYELDDAPDFERFCLVTSTSPIDTGEILERARTGALSDLEVSSFLLKKGTAP